MTSRRWRRGRWGRVRRGRGPQPWCRLRARFTLLLLTHSPPPPLAAPSTHAAGFEGGFSDERGTENVGQSMFTQVSVPVCARLPSASHVCVRNRLRSLPACGIWGHCVRVRDGGRRAGSPPRTRCGPERSLSTSSIPESPHASGCSALTHIIQCCAAFHAGVCACRSSSCVRRSEACMCSCVCRS